MKIELLSAKLKACDDDQLSELHGELIKICTGKPPENNPEVSRQISLVETTNSVRGFLLHQLLGECEGLDDFWIPANRGDRLFPHTRLSFESDPEAEEPRFKIVHPGQDAEQVTQIRAREHVAEGNREEPTHIHIAANFPNLHPGWTAISEPQMPPSDAFFRWAKGRAPDAYWLLTCTNSDAAKSILSHFKGETEASPPEASPPLLVALSEAPDACNSFCGLVPLLGSIREALELIQQFVHRVEKCARPSRASHIYSILKCNEDARNVQKQARVSKQQQMDFTSNLEGAKLRWNKLLLDERRESIGELQLEAVAHIMTKWRLLSHNAREARAHIYAHEQLYPRVQIFLGETLKTLRDSSQARADASADEGSALPPMREAHENAAFLRRGIIQALPSLGLVAPVLMLSIPEAKGAIGRLLAKSSEAGRGTDGGDSGGILEKLRDRAMEPITMRQDALIEGQDDLKESIGKLTDVLIAAGAAGAIGAIIAGPVLSVVAVKGAIALRQTEDLIKVHIDNMEAAWPQIERQFRALAHGLNGGLDQTVVKNAELVLKQLESFRPCPSIS